MTKDEAVDWLREFKEAQKHPTFWIESIKQDIYSLGYDCFKLFKLCVTGRV